jgi:hypothetical protein
LTQTHAGVTLNAGCMVELVRLATALTVIREGFQDPARIFHGHPVQNRLGASHRLRFKGANDSQRLSRTGPDLSTAPCKGFDTANRRRVQN